jgi:cellulose biosynthesis protein BcsQ
MNVIAFASRKGGSGKSTLAAHLAAHVHHPSRRCLLVDDDPQKSLTLWNELRQDTSLPIKTLKWPVADMLRKAAHHGTQWAFIDTPANVSMSVMDAIEAATLVIIPCRPGLFDIDAVQETIALARRARTPYFVVLNGAAPKRRDTESLAVTSARECLAELGVPVWGGQITHRASFSLSVADGKGVREYDADPFSVAEISRLWSAIEKSIGVIKGTTEKAAKRQFAIFPVAQAI